LELVARTWFLKAESAKKHLSKRQCPQRTFPTLASPHWRLFPFSTTTAFYAKLEILLQQPGGILFLNYVQQPSEGKAEFSLIVSMQWYDKFDCIAPLTTQ
jgi:hypothetical protein